MNQNSYSDALSSFNAMPLPLPCPKGDESKLPTIDSIDREQANLMQGGFMTPGVKLSATANTTLPGPSESYWAAAASPHAVDNSDRHPGNIGLEEEEAYYDELQESHWVSDLP